MVFEEMVLKNWIPYEKQKQKKHLNADLITFPKINSK